MTITFRLVKYSLFKVFTNTRFWVTIICTVLTLFSYTSIITENSISMDTSVTPWIFTFLMVKPNITILGMIVVIIFCDAPFIETSEIYLITRTKKNRWFFAQIIYIATMSLIYALFVFVCTIILLLPRLEFSLSWGSFIQTSALYGKISNSWDSVFISEHITVNYEPIMANLFSILMFANVCFIIGSLIFCINICTNKFIGSGIACEISFFSILDPMFFRDIYFYFSIYSWTTLDYISVNGVSNNMLGLTSIPSISLILSISLIAIITFWTVAFIKLKKSDSLLSKNILNNYFS